MAAAKWLDVIWGVSYLVTRSTNAILLYVLVAYRVQCGIIQLLESGLEMQELTRKQKDDSTTENRSPKVRVSCVWLGTSHEFSVKNIVLVLVIKSFLTPKNYQYASSFAALWYESPISYDSHRFSRNGELQRNMAICDGRSNELPFQRNWKVFDFHVGLKGLLLIAVI